MDEEGVEVDQGEQVEDATLDPHPDVDGDLSKAGGVVDITKFPEVG